MAKPIGTLAIIRNELLKRQDMIDNGQEVEPITLNGFYYYLRRIFIERGIYPEDQGRLFRENRTKEVTEECQRMNTTREDLLIFAEERATLYYGGQEYKISLRDLEELSKLGTDIIMIEKAGICKLLEPFTSKAGIATLDSKGFIVEYATKLGKLSHNDGCNIAMITDFDSAGLLMARAVKKQVPQVYRIGIDLDMIQELINLYSSDKEKLDLNILKERYTSGKNFMKRLEGLGPDYQEGDNPKTWDDKLEFLRDYRIEVDSVESAIGINKFWEYIKTKLAGRFPNRDYNRAIEVDDFEYPTLYFEFREKLKQRLISILEDDVKDAKDDLQNYNGIINEVTKKENEIRFNFSEIVDNDESLDIVRSKLQEMINELEQQKRDELSDE